MNVPYQELTETNQRIRNELEDVFRKVVNKEWYIHGEYCTKFESEFAEYCGRKYCIGVGNGLDALKIGMIAMGIEPGDEVIVPANTFIATVLAITLIGAIPVLVDADLRTLNIDISKIESKITKKTKALIVVHLYGRMVDMDGIMEVVKTHKIKLIEDAAQGHGAKYKGKPAGAFGDMAAFSFYPGKNLGALGDGGAIVTDEYDIYAKARMLRNYGAEEKYQHKIIGYNSRLDELQAAFLCVKLKYLSKWNEERKRIAEYYIENICQDMLYIPSKAAEEQNVYHIFPLLCKSREQLKLFLNENGVEINIHYPKPIYAQDAYKDIMSGGYYPITSQICREEISLPIYPGMRWEQVEYVAETINKFCYRNGKSIF